MSDQLIARVTNTLVKQVAGDNNISDSDSNFAIQYLDYYYISDKKKSMLHADISQSILKFQEMFSLPQTGKLDEQTVRAMRWPRCGCPDYVRSSASQGSRWGLKQLTYFVEQYIPGLPKKDQDDILDLAYQQWEDNCDLKITRVASKNSANMIISTGSGRQSNFDGPGGTLAWAYLPPNNNYNGQLLMRFDLGETWVTSPKDRGILLLNVACHEFGHFLGLDHSSAQRALMAPYYSAGITKPQQNDDIPRIQRLYGSPASKPNNPNPSNPNPSNPGGKHTITITGIEDLSQIRIDGNGVSDFTLI
jgi:hypothetical protein